MSVCMYAFLNTVYFFLNSLCFSTSPHTSSFSLYLSLSGPPRSG